MRNPFYSPDLANYLINDGLLTVQSLPQLISTSQQQKIPLITHLVRENIIDSNNILNCCAKHFLLPILDLSKYRLQENLLSKDFILRYRILPISRNQHTIEIAISDPTNHISISAIQFHTGLSVSLILICEKTLDKILTDFALNNQLNTQLECALQKITTEDEPTKQIADEDDGPISEFVKKLIDDALQKQASDIHIEPFADYCRIRIRRDGLLHEVATTPSHFAARLITRLKILAHLNIAERRLPQDGRLPSDHNDLDIRINTCPTLFGEKIVLRLLNVSNIKFEIDNLGMTQDQKHLFIKKLSQPQGLILVTGPTGSGKTITLYSALHYLNKMEKNISTVEDPVEMEFAGINQINTNSRIGLDFAHVLRSLLRQDPDIIMIGEIRDKETADIAVQAAQTGHLVLSTLHTNNAIETISRLETLGINPNHFIRSVSLIIAQRLVRRICTQCNKKYQQKECQHCHRGYSGRTGIFECLPVTEKIAALNTIKEDNWMSLREAGMALVEQGITDVEEIFRVLGVD